jgi:hypothetical protein
LIVSFGTQVLTNACVPKMFIGQWRGTMAYKSLKESKSSCVHINY